MATETIFLGHDNKKRITEPSALIKAEVEVGVEVECPRCGAWTYFHGSAHGRLQECVNGCGLWYGTAGTAIHLTDEAPAQEGET